ncbi:substrate-binding domain-containing protein, partial [Streptomyces albidoflavus]
SGPPCSRRGAPGFAPRWRCEQNTGAAPSPRAGAGAPGGAGPHDRVAAGVLLAAGRLGIAVPEELSVVGYDDQDQMAAHLVPALTTVALPHPAMGAAAVRLLLDAAEAGGEVDTARALRLPCPVVERDSVRPPPSP